MYSPPLWHVTSIIIIFTSILLHLLPLLHVHPHQVDGGEVALKEEEIFLDKISVSLTWSRAMADLRTATGKQRTARMLKR